MAELSEIFGWTATLAVITAMSGILPTVNVKMPGGESFAPHPVARHAAALYLDEAPAGAAR
jgi:hypothetical protein